MKIYTFRYTNYPFSIGIPTCDIIFAESLQQATDIRKTTLKEKYCPSEKCMIGCLEITPGFLTIIKSNEQQYDRYVHACISDEKEWKYGEELSKKQLYDFDGIKHGIGTNGGMF